MDKPNTVGTKTRYSKIILKNRTTFGKEIHLENGNLISVYIDVYPKKIVVEIYNSNILTTRVKATSLKQAVKYINNFKKLYFLY